MIIEIVDLPIINGDFPSFLVGFPGRVTPVNGDLLSIGFGN